MLVWNQLNQLTFIIKQLLAECKTGWRIRESLRYSQSERAYFHFYSLWLWPIGDRQNCISLFLDEISLITGESKHFKIHFDCYWHFFSWIVYLYILLIILSRYQLFPYYNVTVLHISRILTFCLQYLP